MLATIATAVLSLVSPLIGQSYDDRVDRRAKPTSSPTVVHPRTLQPIEDAARLRGTGSVEVSPAGDRIVGVGRDLLVFASLRSGRDLGRMPIDLRQQAVVSWIARDRLLVIDCAVTRGAPYPPFCDETYVRVVDPIEREVVGEALTFPAGFETSRVGSRQLLLLNPRSDFTCCSGPPPAADDGRFPTVLILDSQGRPAHVVELPEINAVGSLDGSLVTGRGRNPDRRRVYRIDAARGRVAAQRTVDRPAERGWLLPSPRGAAVLMTGCECRFYSMARSTLEPGATFDWKGSERPMAAGSGYVAVKYSARRRGHDTLLHYDLGGDREWSREIPGSALVRAIGPYVYVQWTEQATKIRQRTRNFWIDVIRVRDGSRVLRRRGRYNLFPPQAGRSYPQVPGLYASDDFYVDDFED